MRHTTQVRHNIVLRRSMHDFLSVISCYLKSKSKYLTTLQLHTRAHDLKCFLLVVGGSGNNAARMQVSWRLWIMRDEDLLGIDPASSRHQQNVERQIHRIREACTESWS